MKVGDLVVGLGVTGAGKAINALKSVNKGMGAIASSSLETKVAIGAAFFALERMNRFAGNLGAGLTNFSKLTGMSSKQLQQYQHAARKVNITNEEMESTFKGIQQTMGDMMIGKGAPEGLALVGNTVGLDKDKLGDTAYVMQKLQKFANTFKGDITLANTAMRSFGVSDNIIAGFRQMAFTADKMKGASLISDADSSRLSKMNAQLSEMYYGFKINMAKVFSKFMPEVVQGFTDISNLVSNFAKGLMNSKESMEGMKAIVVIIKKTFEVVLDLIGNAIKNIGVIAGYFKGGGILSSIGDFASDMFKGLTEDSRGADYYLKETPKNAGVANNSNTNVKNEINIQGDTNNPQELGETLKKALNGTFWQMNQGATK